MEEEIKKAPGTAAASPQSDERDILAKDILAAMVNSPENVNLRVKSINNKMAVFVTIKKGNFVHKMQVSNGDRALLDSLVGVVSQRIEPIQHYKAEEHPIEEFTKDDLFNWFIKLHSEPIRRVIELDYIGRRTGKRYTHIHFDPHSKGSIHFFFERGSENDKLVRKAIYPKPVEDNATVNNEEEKNV